ncbi:hypothetical protein RB195_021017 [Necator americanus]|uniref:Reverse transcriptase domain-containing protein n=1 Tax=Necator americanus TaxID=51031 RepID=A0ABR1CLS3_NECAM
MPLCLTFIDLKKAFDSVETEAVVEALDNQGVPTQYIKGDTISPKIFTATLENAMRKLEWDDMGVKIDGRQLHHLRFADDIVLITPSISQAERMLTEFAETCGCIGLELNLQKTMFMRNGWISDAPFTLNGTNISECTSYVYLGRELNMMNDLAPELGRRRRAAWGAYKSIEDVVKKTKNTRLRAHLFNTTVLPALTYASETWALRKQEENAVSVIERAIERVMLGVSRSKQVRDGIRSSLLRQRSKIRDAAAFAKESKIRKTADPMVRFLHEVLQRKLRCSSCPTRKEEPLGYSGMRPGQMEELLAPARPVRRPTGVKDDPGCEVDLLGKNGIITATYSCNSEDFCNTVFNMMVDLEKISYVQEKQLQATAILRAIRRAQAEPVNRDFQRQKRTPLYIVAVLMTSLMVSSFAHFASIGPSFFAKVSRKLKIV